MNIKKILLSVKKQSIKQTSEVKMHTLGAIAKKRRIMLNMTQSEVANKICSVSYLSKIESNKIIPNERCLEALMQKVNISKWEIYTLENSEELMKKTIKYILYGQMDEYKELYDTLSDVSNNQCVDVIKLGYYLSTNQLENSKRIIENNNDLVSSMDNYTLSNYLLFTGYYLYKINDLENLSEIIESEDKPNYNSDYEILFDDLSFKYYAASKRPTMAQETYIKLIDEYKNRMIFKRINNLMLDYSYLLLNEREYKRTLIVLDLLNQKEEGFNTDLFNYIKAKAYYELGKMIDAKLMLDFISINSTYYPLIIDIKYELYEDKNAVVEEASKLSLRRYSFYTDYFLKNTSHTLDRDTFNNSKFREFFSKQDYYTKIDILSKEKDFLTSIKRYKEAMFVEKKIKSF